MATNPSIDQLASVTTTGGLNTPSFAEIRNAYAAAMQSIYGSDIDISSASADGQYIMMEALAINNIYRTLDSLYKNIQPASASGKYLDILAGFTNTIRDMGTRSYIYLSATYMGVNATDKPQYLEVKDQSGNYWSWVNPVDITSQPQVTFTKNMPQTIKFVAQTIGPIAAAAGTLFNQTINNDYSFSSSTAAVQGTNKETDASLRARRLFKTGVRSLTIIDTLRSWLYDIPYIKDVYVFNNNTGSSQTMPDTTVVTSHDVYCVVRPDSSVTTTDSSYKQTIGTTIYDALTPGVQTTTAGALSGANSLAIKVIGGSSPITTTVYWKDAQAYQIDLRIDYSLDNGTTVFTTAQQTAIKNALVTYLNDFSISDTLITSTLLNIVNNTDLKTPVEGLSTFHCTTLKTGSHTGSTYTWGSAIDSLPIPLAYFNYSTDNISFQTGYIQISY